MGGTNLEHARLEADSGNWPRTLGIAGWGATDKLFRRGKVYLDF